MQYAKNGIGDIIGPASFVTPQNPLSVAFGQSSVTNAVAKAGGIQGLADIIGPAQFVVPQNPLIGNTVLNGPISLVAPRSNALDGSLRGLACGCCAQPSLNGLGTFDIADPSTYMSSLSGLTSGTIMGIPSLYVIGGGLLLLMLVTSRKGRSAYSSERRAAMAELRAKYPTAAGRVARGYRAALA
jgi:hypothetical protein